MKEIILTHTGKLGDFLYCLPIASWLARERGCKIHWVLPGSFNPFNFISNLLMLQPFTSRVSIVPFEIQNFDCGGQPYKFDPWQFQSPLVPVTQERMRGDEGEYYNLGFRSYPDKFISAFYAEEYGLGYDVDFELKIWDQASWLSGIINNLKENTEILRTREAAMAKVAPGAEPLPPAVDLLDLARRLAAAKEVHSWYCGIAVLCWFARIPCHVYRVPGHASLDLYFPEPKTLTFCEVTL